MKMIVQLDFLLAMPKLKFIYVKATYLDNFFVVLSVTVSNFSCIDVVFNYFEVI